jgi:hypothetical protein
MSFASSLPLAEIVSVGVGFLVSASSFFLSSKIKRRKSIVLAEYLSSMSSWQEFKSKRLSEILEDRRIDDAEWREIISAVDLTAMEISFKDQKFEEEVGYLARSERAKRMLVSDMLMRDNEPIGTIAA